MSVHNMFLNITCLIFSFVELWSTEHICNNFYCLCLLFLVSLSARGQPWETEFPPHFGEDIFSIFECRVIFCSMPGIVNFTLGADIFVFLKIFLSFVLKYLSYLDLVPFRFCFSNLLVWTKVAFGPGLIVPRSWSKTLLITLPSAPWLVTSDTLGWGIGLVPGSGTALAAVPSSACFEGIPLQISEVLSL